MGGELKKVNRFLNDINNSMATSKKSLTSWTTSLLLRGCHHTTLGKMQIFTLDIEFRTTGRHHTHR